MKIGTRASWPRALSSNHPLFVWKAWWRLFGVPWDPRILCAASCTTSATWGAVKSRAQPATNTFFWRQNHGLSIRTRVADECVRHSRSWCKRTGLPVTDSVWRISWHSRHSGLALHPNGAVERRTFRIHEGLEGAAEQELHRGRTPVARLGGCSRVARKTSALHIALGSAAACRVSETQRSQP